MVKKIAVVCGALSIGGAENMICELLCNLNREKYEVKLFCTENEQNTFLEKKIREHGIDIEFAGLSGKVTPRKMMSFYHRLKRFHPDVVHTHISGAVYSLPYVITHDVRHIHTLHTAPLAEFSPAIRKVLILQYKIGKSTLVTVSKENCELAKAEYHLTDREVKCINNGIDVDRYSHKEHEHFTFINVGRQDVNKNQKLIVEAFKTVVDRYPESRLILVGDGNQHNRLIDLVVSESLQDKVTLPGMVANGEDYLSMADVYIQSSHREGLPLSVIEAMAAYLPVISTNVGGVPDVVHDNGFLVADDSVDEMVDAMEKLLLDSALCEKMGSKSRTLSEQFSSKNMAQRYERLYFERKE